MSATGSFPRSIRWAFNFKEWKPTKNEWMLAVQCIQKEENERVHRFVYSKDSKASMIGQILMRKAVSESSGALYDKILFSRTESGKPYVKNYKEILGDVCLNFNVSHHGNYCIIAAEHDYNVGVDIMKIEYTGHKVISDYFNLMKKQFSHHEWAFLNLPGLEKEKLERLYRLWCLKESYVKAKGTGISYNLSKLSFHCPTATLKKNEILTDTKLYIDSELESSWIFEEQLLDEDYCIAVAIENIKSEENIKFYSNRKPLKFKMLSFEELMKNSIPFESSIEKFWSNFSAKPEKP